VSYCVSRLKIQSAIDCLQSKQKIVASGGEGRRTVANSTKSEFRTPHSEKQTISLTHPYPLSRGERVRSQKSPTEQVPSGF
jgi:hypothetical protein